MLGTKERGEKDEKKESGREEKKGDQCKRLKIFAHRSLLTLLLFCFFVKLNTYQLSRSSSHREIVIEEISGPYLSATIPSREYRNICWGWWWCNFFFLRSTNTCFII